MQGIMANGNYAPYLAQALTPPALGATGMMSGYPQGIAPQVGSSGFSPFGIGQGQFGQPDGVSLNPTGGLTGQPGFGQHLGQHLGQHQSTVGQQQQIAATLHHLAHYVASRAAIGQQIVATLQQLAQYAGSQVMAGQQFAQVLNQLAHQSAWTAQAGHGGGFGIQAVHGQSYGQPWGFNRPLW